MSGLLKLALQLHYQIVRGETNGQPVLNMGFFRLLIEVKRTFQFLSPLLKPCLFGKKNYDGTSIEPVLSLLKC